MKNQKIGITVLAALMALPLHTLVQAQDDELVFQERFINTTGARMWMADFGWTALVYDPQFGDPDNLLDLSEDETVAVDIHAHLLGVGATIGHEVCFCDDDYGWVELWNTPRVTWSVLLKDFELDRSQMEITRIVWYDQSGPQDIPFDHDVSAIVKIDGQLYVSDATYDPHEEGHGGDWGMIEHPFTTEGSDWLYLSAEAGSPLVLGDPVEGTLPDGDIEAIGLYLVHPNFSVHQSMRVDDIQVYAKPVEGGGDNGGGDDNGGGETAQWAGYEIVDQDGKQLVDTAGWMGWVDVTGAPWVYPFALNKYVYLEEAAATGESGAWAYVPK